MLKEEIINNVDYKLLMEKEKKARLDNDIPTSSDFCVKILTFIWKTFGNEYVSTVFLSLSKKRNQSKRAHSEMIKYIFDNIYPSLINEDEKVSLLKGIIEITEGKIYVEYEFSLSVRRLTEILLLKGQLDEAVKLIQDIQIETFGSLERKYKVEYILFQMKVLIQKGDFIRTHIVSNKIIRKHLNEQGLEGLKVEFYNLMIKYYNHEEKYLELSGCYKELYDFSVELEKRILNKTDENEIITSVYESFSKKEMFLRYIISLNLCPPKEDINVLIKKADSDYKKELDENKALYDLVKWRLGEDISPITEDMMSIFNRMPIFSDSAEWFNNGKNNFTLFRKYIIQYNILIVSKFFSQINISRISDLIQVSYEEIEKEICEMVTNDYLYARINRIKRIVSFRKKQNNDDRLNDIDKDLYKMLEILESTCHLIHKENLKYDIK
jgi:26S proteasome regulatory subunit N5